MALRTQRGRLLCTQREASTTLGRLCGSSRACPLLLDLLVEALRVHLKASLARHELREVEGEAHRVVQEESRLAVDGLAALRLHRGGVRRKLLDAARQR